LVDRALLDLALLKLGTERRSWGEEVFVENTENARPGRRVVIYKEQVNYNSLGITHPIKGPKV